MAPGAPGSKTQRDCAPFAYNPRRTHKTVLHALVREHLETMLARARGESDGGSGLPFFVERELRAYLDCGIPERGFLRVRCGDCGDEITVGFSCKTRAACPSCATRRMQDTAAHLVSHVLPPLPYRQWVSSYPKWLRIHLALDGDLHTRVLRITLAEIFRWQRRRVRSSGHRRTRVAAVSFLQRFGSALQLNPHVHSVLPDGVFATRYRNAPGAPPEFIPVPPPSDEEVEQILIRIVRRVLRLADSMGLRERPLSDEQQALASTIALPLPRNQSEPAEAAKPRRCASLQGFSLHANVYCHRNDRAALARLCRYALRPPFALERMSLAPDGQVRYRMKRALPNGQRDLVLPPVDFLRRVASLVPPPRRHLTRYFGLFGPNARDRAGLVALANDVGEPRSASQGSGAGPTIEGQSAVALKDTVDASPIDAHDAPRDIPRTAARSRLPWAELLQRVFAVDVFQCARCGGRRRIVAAITNPAVARRILAHQREPPGDLALAPARAPPGTLPFDRDPDDDLAVDPPSPFE